MYFISLRLSFPYLTPILENNTHTHVINPLHCPKNNKFITGFKYTGRKMYFISLRLSLPYLTSILTFSNSQRYQTTSYKCVKSCQTPVMYLSHTHNTQNTKFQHYPLKQHTTTHTHHTPAPTPTHASPSPPRHPGLP